MQSIDLNSKTLLEIRDLLRANPPAMPIWCPEKTLIKICGLTTDQIRSYRLGSPDSGWIEGIHFCRPSTKSTLYNPELIADFLAHIGDRAAHQRAIDAFVSSLPSNRGRIRSLR